MLKGLLGKLYRRNPAKETGDPLNHEVSTMSAKRTAPTGKDNKKTSAKKAAAPTKTTTSTKAVSKPAPQKPSPAKKAAAPVKAVSDKKKAPAAAANKAATKPAIKSAPAPAVTKKASKAVAKPAIKSTPAPAVTKTASKADVKPVSKKPAPEKALIATKKSKGKNNNSHPAKKGEDYMNTTQKNHFRGLLRAWKSDLMQEVDRTVNHMKDEAANFPDPADRATQEEEFSLELRARDRERKLIKKIDSTLELIDQNEYGYCEACGIEIGVERLEVRPTATLCIDCKTLAEIKERQIGT
jgi:DnaK suppressor protein